MTIKPPLGFFTLLIISAIMQSVVFADEFKVSCCLLQCPGIVRTQPLLSDEPIWLQLDIQGLQSNESVLSYEVFANLLSDGNVVSEYRQSANAITASNKSNALFLLEFPRQSPGEYVIEITVTSKNNKTPATCQFSLEIQSCNALHVRNLSFIDSFKNPVYPVFLEKQLINLACIIPEINNDNALTVDIFVDNTNKPVVHNEIDSYMQFQSQFWTLSVDKPGKHELIFVVKDAKGNERRYNLPFTIVSIGK